MDTVNSFKGYGKVDAAEDRDFRRKTLKRLILIGVSTVLLIVIIIGVVVGVVANKRRNSTDRTASPPMSTSSSIKAICSVTRYPDSCFSSISSVKGANATNDPEDLFKLALNVAIGAISKVSAASDRFLSAPTNDSRLTKALQDCKELLDGAVGQLTESLEALQPADGGGKALTEGKVDDLMSWISAAVTNQETCLDGFEGTTGGFREKMEAAMVNSTQFTSNGLAIVKGILGIMANLNFPVHRKLLTTVPVWASASQRRALLQEGGSKPNVTVAADGSGDVKTVKEAVEMVPMKNMYPFVIYVKSGEYMENVVVEKNKWNVQMYGDGMYKTIVNGRLNQIDRTPTFSTATFVAVGKSFMARDMGFKNSAGPQKQQAVALRSGSDHSIFYRCSFDAFQDTLYAHSCRQFYRDCDITGTVDFIFGNAAVVFQNCNIRPRQPLPNQKNTITAQGRTDPGQETGISIQGSIIAPYDSVMVRTYLGRPWKDYSRTVIMQTEIPGMVDPAGWMSWNDTIPTATVYCAEYQNTGPGAAVARRVTWPGYKSSISAEEAKQYTVGDFIQGKNWISETGVEFTSNL